MPDGTAPGLVVPDLDDIQGMALRVYRFPVARHRLLRIDDAAAARGWLGMLAAQVASVAAIDAGPPSAVNLAVSASGLVALGLPAESLDSFAEPFRQGMAARAAALGDVGDQAPDRWDPPWGRRELHALLTLSAISPTALEAADPALRDGMRGVTVLGTEEVALLPDAAGRPAPVEHFGYRDGIAQPAIAGDGAASARGQGRAGPGGSWRKLQPGEFVLGLPDESGAAPPLPRPEALARSGTYLAVRKLHQHVARFRAYLDGVARDDGDREWLAARLLGRWPSGAPLALAAEADDHALAADDARVDDFDYAGDPGGRACPVGAHLRRMNPRAGLAGPAGATVHRHRVLRQGLPYGPPLAPGAPEDGVPRGALLLIGGADPARQFEFVQKVWIGDGDFAGLGRDKDPLIGAQDGTGGFTIPQRGQPRRRLSALPAFVATRGGEYFLLPGRRALAHLAAGPGAPPKEGEERP
ncbi:hypothetical protein LPC08_14995 [Roseomonas sp. OT10]|uniref:Dyp-type peroxidase n=1 Tax=Roseomonas cutis TaxID=2897332 RepID=UPI001E52D905|nr:hypothetical protein [Roseomonas sp. OT10]UFN47325.1 hypothetical protein LPC08_14995 [Roseomonas sp. OT10]